tara:strand:+ start:442 stop:615 length:174 start_codon:yes stop_codon:yes gene_type:complete
LCGWDFFILEREREGYGFVEGDIFGIGVLVLFVDFFDNFTDSLKMENKDLILDIAMC